MKEQLISLETAKLAKEKGFDLESSALYDEKCVLGINHQDYKRLFTNSKEDTYNIAAPTQSLLQKWLREVHGINIFMTFKPNIKKWDFIPYFMSMDGKEYIKYNSEYTKIHNERRFDTYEEALELGLQEGLKLI